MGFKQVEIVPVSTTGPTQLIPSGKNIGTKVFQATRTDTVAVVKAVTGASTSILKILVYGSVNSDAATTATVTLTVSNNTGVISTGVVDVKANGATTALVQMSNLPNVEPVPATGDLQIKAVYAETGGASTVGGPWKFAVEYV